MWYDEKPRLSHRGHAGPSLFLMSKKVEKAPHHPSCIRHLHGLTEIHSKPPPSYLSFLWYDEKPRLSHRGHAGPSLFLMSKKVEKAPHHPSCIRHLHGLTEIHSKPQQFVTTLDRGFCERHTGTPCHFVTFTLARLLCGVAAAPRRRRSFLQGSSRQLYCFRLWKPPFLGSARAKRP